MQKIGIIGSGAVGKALAKGFLDRGYPTTIASRSAETRQELAKELGDSIQTATPEDTARESELIVFAVKGTAAKKALEGLGIENLAGKIVMDATNPIAAEPPVDGVLKYFTDQNASLMEELQAMAPEARFVKAYSSVGSAHMVDPQFGSRPTMFICGNDEQAKKQVTGILDQFGWDTADMGSAVAARAIEPLAKLWIIPGIREGSWGHAFKLMR